MNKKNKIIILLMLTIIFFSKENNIFNDVLVSKSININTNILLETKQDNEKKNIVNIKKIYITKTKRKKIKIINYISNISIKKILSINNLKYLE